MFAPGGVASLILMNLRVAKYKLFGRLWTPYAKVLSAAAVLLAGIIMVVEMSYHLTLGFSAGGETRVLGFDVDASAAPAWIVAALLVAVGGWLFHLTRKGFAAEWGGVQAIIEDRIQRGQAA
jgi:branched-chain amino acid transport system permease protein